MTQPVQFPMQLYQGASWVLKATFRDKDGVALDLTTYAARLQIRRIESSTDPLLTLDSTDVTPGILLTDDDPFNLTVRISATQTSELPTGLREVCDWGYDLKLWETADPDFTTIVLLTGEVIVTPLNTRPEA